MMAQQWFEIDGSADFPADGFGPVHRANIIKYAVPFRKSLSHSTMNTSGRFRAGWGLMPLYGIGQVTRPQTRR
jgi:hypothetical protein